MGVSLTSQETATPAAASTPDGPPHDLTPRRIVDLLDAHLIGQSRAKRAVAVALRNRERRQRVAGPLREDITPRNILLIGPTGVGKTELARRLAELAGAPFLKVEATGFTEVGYVGRNVESMITDLFEVGLQLAKQQCEADAAAVVSRTVAGRLLDLLHPWPKRQGKWEDQQRPDAVPAEESLFGVALVPADESPEQRYPQDARIREQLALDLAAGRLESRIVAVPVEEHTFPQGLPPVGSDQEAAMTEVLSRMFVPRRRRRRMPVREAREVLTAQELARCCDQATITQRARLLVEQHGIIFLDEIDKIAEPERGPAGSRVSREGVQRDLLPLIEGTSIRTRYGPVKTDHILFIAAGAFHLARPEALIPELQGRFPVQVTLDSLGVDEFVRILTEPRSALTKQYSALLATDGVVVRFLPDGLQALAERAVQLNRTQQDIGARRLQQLLERVVEEIAFRAPEGSPQQVDIDSAYVLQVLGQAPTDRGLDSYIL